MILHKHALSLLLVAVALGNADAFTVSRSGPSVLRAAPATPLFSTTAGSKNKRGRSRVTDPVGPTPEPEYEEPEVVNVEDIPELHYDEKAFPIPHQPWRRGVTDGCEAPIDADWRQEAEEIIVNAARAVGGQVIDCTWYLTSLIVTIDENLDTVPVDPALTGGPEIEVHIPKRPVYRDPDDPNPEPIWADTLNDPVYVRDKDADTKRKKDRYVKREEGDGPDDEEGEGEQPPLYYDVETRGDVWVAERLKQLEMKETAPRKVEDISILTVNTDALSVIAGAIIDALTYEEERLQVLHRHELVLAAPGPPGVLETQKQFDANRNMPVYVETADPWDSNRTLKGRLVDRNSMDLIIKKQGRMVTIPLNFITCVRLATVNKDFDYDEFEKDDDDQYSDEVEDDEEYEYEYEEEDDDYDDD